MAYGTRRFNAAFTRVNNPYPEPNQPNSSYDTYFFNVHANIVLPSTSWPVKCDQFIKVL